MDHDEDFAAADAGASLTQPISAGNVKKGSFVMLKDHPCRVVEYSTSKTGKHGHAKANIVGIDIFTGNKYQDMCPTSHNMEEPVVKRTQHQFISIDNDFVSFLMPDGNVRSDISIKDDAGMKDQLEKFQASSDREVIITVLAACGQEKIVEVKESTN